VLASQLICCFNADMYKKATVIGDGAMGSVCAMLLCDNGLDVTMWGYDPEYIDTLNSTRENIRFLPGYKLPDSLKFQCDPAKALDQTDMVLSAVPCQFMRTIWTKLKDHISPDTPIASVTKGIEQGTLMRPSQILEDILHPSHGYASLSGPTIADEIVRHLPATATAASADQQIAMDVQKAFNTPYFRVYTNDDVIGVELAGALKNVIAIAAGVIDGIGAGDNAKAALLARGLAEIKRLGLALGAKDNTFAGLSGLGDLVTTCVSPSGRNRSFGERIGKGQTAKEALNATQSVVEGAATAISVTELAKKHKVEMPIAQAVHDVIYENLSVENAIHSLMSRQLKHE